MDEETQREIQRGRRIAKGIFIGGVVALLGYRNHLKDQQPATGLPAESSNASSEDIASVCGRWTNQYIRKEGSDAYVLTLISSNGAARTHSIDSKLVWDPYNAIGASDLLVKEINVLCKNQAPYAVDIQRYGGRTIRRTGIE
jgi:hypothetical protein